MNSNYELSYFWGSLHGYTFEEAKKLGLLMNQTNLVGRKVGYTILIQKLIKRYFKVVGPRIY